MKLIMILACSLIPLLTTAQVKVADAWKAMPDSILPYLNASVRAEMVDTYNASPGLESKNLLDGKSYIKELKNNYASIQINSSTNMQIMTLPKKDSTYILCVVKTYGMPEIESSISFYSPTWEKLKDMFGLPDISEPKRLLNALTLKPDTMTQDKFHDISRTLEPATIITKLSTENNTPIITLNINCPLLTNKEREELKSIQKQKSLKWNGTIFK